MRELIYLSESKLDQFASASPPFRPKAGSIGAGGLSASIEFSQEGSERDVLVRRLEMVVKFLDQSSSPPRYFSDPDVANGDWVHFDDFMTLAIITSSHHELAICVQRADHFSGDVGLLLYGSPRYVLPYEQRAGRSTDIRELDSWVGSLADIMNELGTLEASGQDDGVVSHYGIADLFQRVAGEPGLSAEMEGLARVVSVEEEPEAFTYRQIDGRWLGHRPSRLVVASPLYVQYRRQMLKE